MNSILWTLSLICISEGYNISDKLSSERQVRHKRNDETIIPNILKVRYHQTNHVELVVLKKVADSTLVGPHMPVWYIEDDNASHHRQPYENISHVPTFYHGVNSFSSLTYFPRTQTLYGVLDQNIYIEDLPLHSVANPDLVDTFVHPIPDELKSRMNVRNRRAMDGKRKSSESPKCSPRKRIKGDEQKKMLYPEIYLIVDVLPEKIDPAPQHEFDRAMIYVLAYWNAVDMLFRNLKRTDVHINIAGILFGKTQGLEHWGWVDANHIRINDPDVFILRNDIFNQLGTFFHDIQIIERDSYDFLIWMTSAKIIDSDVWFQENESTHDMKQDYTGEAAAADCGGLHSDELRDHRVSNRAIVVYDNAYAQYHLAARELAHLMFVADDDVEVLHDFHYSNCLSSTPISRSSGIMDPSSRRLEGFQFWSYCSEIHLEKYSRSRSSCCLLNYPSRTMTLPDPPHYLTVATQCECYGMGAPDIINYGENFCDEPLKCKSEDGHHSIVAKLLDGTPCVPEGEEDRNFCNHNECP